MTQADIMIQSNVSNNMRAGCQQSPVHRKANGTLYTFLIDGGNIDLQYTRSNDGGLSWSDLSAVFAGTAAIYATWADWQTPGDTGTKIHIAYMETDNDDVSYCNLDVATESLSTPVVVAALVSGTGNNASTMISITKARGGNLLIGFDIDGGTETGFYRSTDGGVNWTSRANLNEAASSDYYLLAPGFNVSDSQDIMAIFWDRSASEISRKIYDDSADSWAESSISGSMTAIASTTCVPHFALTVDATNSRLVLIAWSNRDTANADLKTWWITEAAITAKTDVVTDSTDDQQMCSIGLATDTGYLYAVYGGKSDGSETAGTSIGIYYKVSTDNGATWGSETVLSANNRNYDCLYTTPIFTGTFVAVFRCTSTSNALFISYTIPTANLLAGKL